MTLATPTTKQISDNIILQLETSLNQTIPLLPKSFIRVLSNALGAVFVILYKYSGFIFQQLFVQTASFKDTEVNGVIINPLIAWGELLGVGPPTEATNAEMTVIVTVENQTGLLLSGSQLLNTANGFIYIIIGSVPLNAATIQATIRAVSDQSGGDGAGVAGNLSVNDIVSFVNPLPNVARDTTVNAQTLTAADAEAESVYRQRVLDRFQKPPQGGAMADYEIWGEEVEGIINIFPYTSDCPGQVDVFVEATIISSGDPDGIPTTAQLQQVRDSIELDKNGLPSRRPANALVNTFPITRLGFEVKVTGIVSDNIAQVQTDITTAVKEYFLAREPFISGLSVLPRKDRITRTAVGGIVNDVLDAVGGSFIAVTIVRLTVPIELFTLGIGEKAKASAVTFV